MEAIQATLDRIGTDNPPTAEELRSAKAALKSLIQDEGGQTDPNLEVLTSLKAAYDETIKALTTAEEAEAEARAQVDELLAGIQDETDKAEAEVEVEVETEDAVDLDKEPVLAGGNVRILPLSEAAARVRERPKSPEPSPIAPRYKTLVRGREFAGPIDLKRVASEFSDSLRSPNVGKQTLVRFDTEAADGWALNGNVEQMTNIIESKVSPEAVAAAGGCCTMPEPIRTLVPVAGSTDRPLRDSLPSFNVTTTGAVTFYPAICIPQAGVAEWTCAEDALVDPDDPETWKECAVFECDDAVIETVNAIYRCLTIGNFQRRFDGARWAQILQATLVSQARIAEQALWAKMLARVQTTHILGDTGSLLATLVQGLSLAGAIIRQDQRYEGVNLHFWAPTWVRDAIRADLVTRRLVEADNPVAADAWISTQLSNIGITVTWTPDVNIIDADVVSGPLPDYPAFADTILAPEGYYTFLDGGQFDLGTEIRDHDLNRQNAVATFAESFEGLMSRGCAAMRLTVPVSVCDLAAGCLPVS